MVRSDLDFLQLVSLPEDVHEVGEVLAWHPDRGERCLLPFYGSSLNLTGTSMTISAPPTIS